MSAAGAVGIAGCTTSNSGESAEQTPTVTPTDATPRVTERSLFPEDDPCSSDATVDYEDPLAVDVDPIEALKCRGRLLDPLNDLEEWEIIGGDASTNSERPFSGPRSVELAVGPMEKRFGIKRAFDEPLDLSSSVLSISFNLLEPAWESLVIELVAPDDDNTVMMKRGVWRSGWVRLDFGPRRVNGTPDLSDVREIRISMYTGGGTTARFLVDSLRVVDERVGGKALLTFDDNHISQYETAFPLLNDYDYTGLVAAIPWADDGERIPVSGLSELDDAGWDIASHPQREASFRELDPAEKRDAIRSTKQWLLENGFESGSRFIVWPYGRYDAETLEIAREYHHLGFTTDGSPQGAVTGPLTVSRVSGDDVEAAKRAIDLAAAYDQNIVISYHRVGDYESQVSAAGLEETLAHLKSSSLDVITASEYFESIQSFADAG